MSQGRRPLPVVLPATALLLLLLGWIAWESFRSTAAPPPPPPGMAYIPGGVFEMGSSDPSFPDAPLHRVRVSPFFMDVTEVTNAQFAAFVQATGYVTLAERKVDPAQVPGLDPKDVRPEDLDPFSTVFAPPREAVPLNDVRGWWRAVKGANWRRPEGGDSTIEQRGNHPVVHVAYEDAEAYATWAGKRLPTEAEWEFAARGGLAGKTYVWGDELRPEGRWKANIWQGKFPNENTREDGHVGTAPVGSFGPNGYGLLDMAGNVWEWCADWYRHDYFVDSPGRDPRGPRDSLDPQEPGIPKRVQRGGSYLCSDLYCVRYKVGSRGKGEPGSPTGHVGFRCAKDLP